MGDDTGIPERPTPIGIEAGGDVDREHVRAALRCLGDGADRGRDRPLRRARRADAEQGVDDESGCVLATAGERCRPT